MHAGSPTDRGASPAPGGSRRVVGVLVGVLVAGLGAFGSIAPGVFASLVAWFQVPPAIYLAAVIRVATGVGLVHAAPASRSPKLLRALGALIAIGGLITPVVGVPIGRAILVWWSEGGAPLIRLFGAGAGVLGAFIIHACSKRGLVVRDPLDTPSST